MAVINVDDIYILGETGAQVDKVTGLFTKDENTDAGEKAFAQLNIGTAGSNRNLLDNPWFTVNQREFTSVTGTNGVKTVDRWEVNNGGGTGGTISVTSEGYISLVTGSAYISYQEKFGKDELAGKTVTMSINDDGNIYSYSFTVPARTESTQIGGSFIFKEGCRCNFFVMPQSSAYGYNFQISVEQGYSATIRAVKLELGSVSTLANDAPPRYKSELDDCNFYCRVLKGNLYNATGIAVASTQVRFTLPYQMYKQPTPSFSGTIRVLGTGGFLAVSAVAVSGWSESNVEIACTVSGATTYAPYFLSIGDNSQIVLSADL